MVDRELPGKAIFFRNQLLAGYWAWFALGGILLFFVASFWYWHVLDTSPVEFDQAVYYSRSDKFFRQLATGDIASITRDLEYGTDNRLQPLRPVLVPFLTSLSYLALGYSRNATLLTPMMFGILLIVSCYVTGREWLGPGVGLLGAFITTMLPLVSIFSRHYYLEIPLAAVCTATIYLLIRRDTFANPITGIGIGTLAGIGMLTRETYPMFMVGPFLAGSAAAIMRTRRTGKLWNVIFGAFLSLSIALAIAVPFYWPKLKLAARFLPSAYGSAKSAQYHGVEAASRLDLSVAYTYVFGQFGVSVTYLLLLVVLTLVLLTLSATGMARLRIRQWVPGAVVIVLWLAVPYAVSSTSYTNDLRYIVPALPAFAIFLSTVILALPWARVRLAIITFTVVLGLIQFYSVGFVDGYPRWNGVSSSRDIFAFYEAHGAPSITLKHYTAQVDSLALPQRGDWKVDEILLAIDQRRQATEKTSATIFLVSWLPSFNPGNFITSASFLKYPVAIRGAGNKSVSVLLEEASSSDYLIVKGGSNGGADVQAVVDALPTLPFKPTGDHFALPDGSEAVIYERTAPR